MHPTTMTNLEVLTSAPKYYPCWKCNGVGTYRGMGVCFACGGRGKTTSKPHTAPKFMDAPKALEMLRRIYRATTTTDYGDWHVRDSSTAAYGAEAFASLLAAGDTANARKVFAAFLALAGGHFAHGVAFRACVLSQWAYYPADAQRLALELAGRTCPLTLDSRGDALVDAKSWSFND